MGGSWWFVAHAWGDVFYATILPVSWSALYLWIKPHRAFHAAHERAVEEVIEEVIGRRVDLGPDAASSGPICDGSRFAREFGVHIRGLREHLLDGPNC